MPDLITHCLASRIILLGRLKKYLLLFALGTILPDVLSRVPVLFMAGCYRCAWAFTVLHSPLPLILFVLLLSLLFTNKKQAFFSLFFGMVLHLGLDSLQKHISESYYWFFPFSFKTAEFGLFYPETSLYFILPLLLISLLIYTFELYFRGRKAQKKS